MKLTTEQITEIIFMKNSKIPTKEIIGKFQIAKGTIYWHTNPLYRERLRKYQREWYSKLTKEQKTKIFESKKDYQRIYHKERYERDDEFRKKQQESSKRSNKK